MGYWGTEVLQFVGGEKLLAGLARVASKGGKWIKGAEGVMEAAKAVQDLSKGEKIVESGKLWKAVVEVETSNSEAKLAINSVRLQKQLASEAQMVSEGKIIVNSDKLKKASKLAKQYGGKAENWVKKASDKFISKDGVKFEIHWYENLKTGQRVEFKTKF